MLHKKIADRAKETIERDGYFVQFVFGEENALPYGYTSGLSYARDEHFPEFVIAGFPAEFTSDLLHDLVRAARNAEFIPYGAGYYGNLLRDFDVGVVPIDPRGGSSFLGVAEEAETYLIVLPDRNGLFPWETGCDPMVARQTDNFACIALPPSRSAPPVSGVVH